MRKGSEPFAREMENYIYDASSIVSSLLHRCQDYAALQTCFAKGGLRERLPPAQRLSAFDMPERRQQLVHRVQLRPDDAGESLRVSTGPTDTVKLLETTPIETVFHHMQRMQNSWKSAVQLNVELKRACDMKEEQLYALMTRTRLIGTSLDVSAVK
ncbi:hypothetical protein STCU_10468 [Strigomonas culicis]|uniref:Uncharacterized protein n=1 Tax=Strigomonas culicis TaxID=28005 RepID=S9V493_9TRYP|nr:hypothetical protein STCU_10468 [Strigomonas culicis]|eukprot:EPY17675.1 hypothetical protein STCU_10468 [Strigomonas culicis]